MTTALLFGALGAVALTWLGRPSSSPASVMPLDGYAPLQRQTHCDPTPKPGVVAFRDMVLARFAGLTDLGIERDCSRGGVSEHKEGRALDLGVTSRGVAERFLAWLLEVDAHNRPHARLRRAGIMYLIYDRHIWRAYRERAWRPYTGYSPHSDHIHLSFSWEGANALTSLYRQPLAYPLS